jgi:DNA-binding protein Fis
MADDLHSGDAVPLTIENGSTIQDIANKLAGAGLWTVSLAELESAALTNALARCNGNRTHAAHLLGISVRTLQRKLKAEASEPPI